MATLVFKRFSTNCCFKMLKKFKMVQLSWALRLLFETVTTQDKHNNVLYVVCYVVFNDISYFPNKRT